MNIAATNLDDLEQIVTLLQGADLPVADLTPDHLTNFLVARDDGRLVGVAGLEVHARDGLLRSLVVAPTHRGQGLGGALVAAVEALARRRGLETLTLLTTTAASFFARLGYRPIDRREAPASLQATAEFARLCPSSARCLAKALS